MTDDTGTSAGETSSDPDEDQAVALAARALVIGALGGDHATESDREAAYKVLDGPGPDVRLVAIELAGMVASQIIAKYGGERWIAYAMARSWSPGRAWTWPAEPAPGGPCPGCGAIG